ncbi:MAG: HAD-IA family hydrolase [Hyphomicrobiales bacterium]|nr:HAD-IA family hydrolase [Hyphomicrobiales bacterium]MDE2115817.1 HAD-IA family hydrolase [Hyphomicrobiales bacterium]
MTRTQPGKPGLLFDLDGTLTNADHFHHAAFNVLLAQSGRQIDQAQFHAKVMGRANAVIFAELFPDVPPSLHKVLADEKEAQYRALAHTLHPLPGLVALLTQARAQGVACVVVTNAPRANAKHSIHALGLTQYFSAVVCGEELPHSKPHPLPYEEGLRLAGIDVAHAVGFEDSIAGLQAGIAAGLPMMGMTTGLSASTLTGEGATLAIADYTSLEMLGFASARCGVNLAGGR